MTHQSAILAATAILMRNRAGAPELLMVERSPVMAFAPGALVFPGGRIDPGDTALAAAARDAPADAAARIAAVRETIEEAGIAPGLELSPDVLGAVRAGGIMMPTPCWDALVPFARWRPREGVSRVFDTRFYIACPPTGAEPLVDGTENVRAFWTTAADALASAALIYPTRRVLERLALFASFEAAVADARARSETVVTPWVEPRGGVPHLCIPAGLGYPVTAEPLTQVVRG